MNWRLLLMVTLSAGCASNAAHDELQSVPFTNDRGHVIGHKDITRDASTGHEVEKATFYTPRFAADGEIVAYEETVREGVVIRSVDGKRIGMRYNDLRSRGTNPTSPGIRITFPGGSQEP